MRRTIALTAAGVAALAGAGGALAHSLDSNGLKTSQVAATFSAAPASNISARSCTGGDGTYIVTKGSWNGTAASANSRLSGAIVIRGELGVNLTTGLGWLVGRVAIDGGSDGRNDAGADIRGVIAGGKLTGFVLGRVRDAGSVYGSITATIANGGLSDGQIGSGSIAVPGNAIVVDRGSCTPIRAQKPVIEAKGTVTAVSAASITVQKSDGSSQVCAVGADLAATVAKLKAGDTVTLTCGLVDGSYRVLRVQATVLQQRAVLRLEGAVTALSASSITIADRESGSIACAVGSDLAATVARISAGQKVNATCGLVDGSYRLLSVRVDR